MVRDQVERTRAPDLNQVLDALHDPDCRIIVRHLGDPMTAQEIVAATDIPQSTAYRKLDLLTDATLLCEETELRPDGHHTTRYRIDIEEVRIRLTDDRSLDMAITRPARTPGERIAALWSEVQRET